MANDPASIASRNRLVLLQARDIDDWNVDTLIEWSSDENSDVRDWATFALAISDQDSEAIRNALLARVCDVDFDTRSEAILGLASRRDHRVLPHLVEALARENVGALSIEAAGLLGLEELRAPLERLVGWWDVDEELLTEAIESCRAPRNDGGGL
jgi:hypothetical protein